MLDSTLNLLLVLVGFGAVIFIHELGHFLAARWAGVRVHAFAVGFGQAVASFRKGMGFRLGSSEPEYLRLVAQSGGTTPTERDAAASNERFASGVLRGVSPTEYRLNWIPFGGYVKMLGQEDANPGATSSAPDSFAVRPVWKRMVIISAGVVMNTILAAALFVVVFMAGMREVAPIIGYVVPGSPADAAGIKAGDLVRTINGAPAVGFSDLQIATAMSGPGESVTVGIARGDEGLDIEIKPTVGGTARLRQIGVGPAISLTVASQPARPGERKIAQEMMDKAGFAAVPMGSRVEAINGAPVPRLAIQTIEPLRDAARDSNGSPVSLRFRTPDGGAVEATLMPEAAMGVATAPIQGREPISASHVLGFMPLMKAANLQPAARSAGLVEGDVFIRIGEHDFPDIATAVAAIRSKSGSSIGITVQRGDSPVQIDAPVSAEGTIGFNIAEDLGRTRIAAVTADWSDGAGRPVQAVGGIPAGSSIVAVNRVPVSGFKALSDALKRAAAAGPTEGQPIEISFRAFGADGAGAADARATLGPEQSLALRSVEWSVPDEVERVFNPAQIIVKAGDPLHAVGMGVAKTKKVLVMTYLTFARLFQGTVKVEHLKGPVGIADLGSRFAEEGFIYMLFFLGLISANLAVVNFLPLPIVDGGLFLMLCYEGIARKPVPVRVQNAVTIAGLALIGTMFLVVTFNDISNLVR